MSACRLTDEQQAQVRAMTLAGVAPAEQARRLELPVTRIAATRDAVLAEHPELQRPRPPWRPWSSAEEVELKTLIDEGHGYDEIAAKLSRTRESVLLKCQRLGHRLLDTAVCMTARDVAALMGKGCAKSVTGWITTYHRLPAKASEVNGRRIWRISIHDLHTMLERRETWMAWEPARITDPQLRLWATELRAGQPRWLTHQEIARRYGVHWGTVGSWIDKGLLPAVRYGNWWIWEGDLDGFVLPCSRSFFEQRKPGAPLEPPRSFAIDGGVTITKIAPHTKWRYTSRATAQAALAPSTPKRGRPRR